MTARDVCRANSSKMLCIFCVDSRENRFPSETFIHRLRAVFCVWWNIPPPQRLQEPSAWGERESKVPHHRRIGRSFLAIPSLRSLRAVSLAGSLRALLSLGGFGFPKTVAHCFRSPTRRFHQTLLRRTLTSSAAASPSRFRSDTNRKTPS